VHRCQRTRPLLPRHIVLGKDVVAPVAHRINTYIMALIPFERATHSRGGSSLPPSNGSTNHSESSSTLVKVSRSIPRSGRALSSSVVARALVFNVIVHGSNRLRGLASCSSSCSAAATATGDITDTSSSESGFAGISNAPGSASCTCPVRSSVSELLVVIS
jgi:hypothetical protein